MVKGRPIHFYKSLFQAESVSVEVFPWRGTVRMVRMHTLYKIGGIYDYAGDGYV